MPHQLPQLIALTGPSRGATYALAGKKFSIGRDPASQLRLNDRLVSGTHALIAATSGQFEIRDLDSTNGTMVNGVPVKQRQLEHCDQIAIGNSLLLFLLHESEAQPDSFATAFMTRFYAYLDSMPSDEALRCTQIDCLKGRLPEYRDRDASNPLYWAGYNLLWRPDLRNRCVGVTEWALAECRFHSCHSIRAGLIFLYRLAVQFHQAKCSIAQTTAWLYQLAYWNQKYEPK